MESENRVKVRQVLEIIRPLLAEGKLWLFLGEGVSSLPSGRSTWWNHIGTSPNEVQDCVKEVERCESIALKDNSKCYLYNTLRAVSAWPGGVTLNLDHLLEKLVWKGDPNLERIRLDQLADNPDSNGWVTSGRKLLVKVYGDLGLVTRLQPELRDILSQPSPDVDRTLQTLMNSRSFLFLGVDKEIHSAFFQRFVVPAKMQHYMLLRSPTTRLENHGSLTSLCTDLELWEFVTYLSPGTLGKNITAGQVYERSYLGTQRVEYLVEQKELESKGSEIMFHTLQITNALATDELLTEVSMPKLMEIFKKDPLGSFSENDVQKAFQAMIGRRDNLWSIIDGGIVPVKALFFFEDFMKEVEQKKDCPKPEPKREVDLRKMAVRKYADAVLRSRSVLRPNSTLELLVVEGLSPEEADAMKKETFALIKLQGGNDEALCYAETARAGENVVQTHLIVINGTEVANKRRVMDRSISKAWTHKESLLRIAAVLVKEDNVLHALDAEVRRQIEALHSVVSMLDKSIDAKSLKRLGGGSFGDVYKAVWNGQTVALKFLRDAALPSDIAGFEGEFRRLQEAVHENIVRVHKLTVENNRLGLIMEYVDGGTVRDLIQKGPQPSDVTRRCAEQVAAGINHLHERNIVHRDIKSDNILVTKDLLTFKLADFGLARVVEQTEQYKTIKGTYRYIAPEILRGHDGAAKYSLKVDVYSYGLMILELVTGTQVFDGLTREQLESGKRDGHLAPTIPDNCETVHGLVLTTVITLATAPDHRRPYMSNILQMLHMDSVPDPKSPTTGSSSCSILCLGTGKGATTLMHGEPSSSFVVMNGTKPMLLVDLGFGVTFSYRKHVSKDLPVDRIFITHNHADHAAELPVLLSILQNKRQENCLCKQSPPTIFAAPEVMDRLRSQRLPEISTQAPQNDLAEWKVCNPGSHSVAVDPSAEFELQVLQSQHSEVCYGFLLFHRGVPLLSYGADSGFSRSLYEKLFVAPNVILDARTNSSYEHAGFAEVKAYLQCRKDLDDKKVFVTGYGLDSEFPSEGISGTTQMRTGEEYGLLDATDVAELPASRTKVTMDYVGTAQALKSLR